MTRGLGQSTFGLRSPGWWLWALLALVVGFSLRVWRLGDSNVWYDEGYSVFMARQTSAALPHAIASDGHPILYFAVLHGWRALTGDSTLALRYPSALFGVLSLAVGYRLIRRLAGPRAAVLALLPDPPAAMPELIHAFLKQLDTEFT